MDPKKADVTGCWRWCFPTRLWTWSTQWMCLNSKYLLPGRNTQKAFVNYEFWANGDRYIRYIGGIRILTPMKSAKLRAWDAARRFGSLARLAFLISCGPLWQLLGEQPRLSFHRRLMPPPGSRQSFLLQHRLLDTCKWKVPVNLNCTICFWIIDLLISFVHCKGMQRDVKGRLDKIRQNEIQSEKLGDVDRYTGPEDWHNGYWAQKHIVIFHDMSCISPPAYLYGYSVFQSPGLKIGGEGMKNDETLTIWGFP